MKRIAVTGLHGALGKHMIPKNEAALIDLFHEHPAHISETQHQQCNLSRPSEIASILTRVHPDVMVHMAALTHIDRCESDRKHGKDGEVWKVNVDATAHIAQYCAQTGTPMIFLSTECVFDGEKAFFAEHDHKNPRNWYGVTKSAAEDAVLSSGAPAAILRSVIAYHENDEGKTMYGKIHQAFRAGAPFRAVRDQQITPTYIPDILYAIDVCIEKKLVGIFHFAPKISTTPFDFARAIAKKIGIDDSLVQPTILLEYFGKERANLRLQHACLAMDETVRTLDFRPKEVHEVLQLL